MFSDPIYSAVMVEAINEELTRRSPATETWLAIEAIALEHTGYRSLDTAPRELLLSLIIDDLKLPGWRQLASAYGWRI